MRPRRSANDVSPRLDALAGVLERFAEAVALPALDGEQLAVQPAALTRLRAALGDARRVLAELQAAGSLVVLD